MVHVAMDAPGATGGAAAVVMRGWMHPPVHMVRGVAGDVVILDVHMCLVVLDH